HEVARFPTVFGSKCLLGGARRWLGLGCGRGLLCGGDLH
ncbi:unnamed protein product, partial [Tetraodon nigroviridis]